MEDLKAQINKIEAGVLKNPLDEMKPVKSITATPPEASLTHTQFVKWAKEAGYEKAPKEPTESQKILRQAVISFFAMAIILWVDWFYSNTNENVFLGTWQDFIAMLKITAVLFVQIVLAKIKQYYEIAKGGKP